jgi:hypothetical protein
MFLHVWAKWMFHKNVCSAMSRDTKVVSASGSIGQQRVGENNFVKLYVTPMLDVKCTHRIVLRKYFTAEFTRLKGKKVISLQPANFSAYSYIRNEKL